jgi:hypothetical protein
MEDSKSREDFRGWLKNMDREKILQGRIKLLTWVFIIGLVVSGATAIPLEWELDVLANCLGVAGKASSETPAGLAHWILTVRDGLHDTNAKYPFMAYGTDWLAFGHFVIAVVFIGALRDPVRNVWLFTFGMIACAMVVPYAFILGGVRGIPIGWRLIDCSFGVFGIIPVWWCRRWVREIEEMRAGKNG